LEARALVGHRGRDLFAERRADEDLEDQRGNHRDHAEERDQAARAHGFRALAIHAVDQPHGNERGDGSGYRDLPVRCVHGSGQYQPVLALNSSPGTAVRSRLPAMRYALVASLVLALMATRADAGRGTSSLKYLPDDTNVVIVGDVARARG